MFAEHRAAAETPRGVDAQKWEAGEVNPFTFLRVQGNLQVFLVKQSGETTLS